MVVSWARDRAKLSLGLGKLFPWERVREVRKRGCHGELVVRYVDSDFWDCLQDEDSFSLT